MVVLDINEVFLPINSFECHGLKSHCLNENVDCFPFLLRFVEDEDVILIFFSTLAI